MDIFGDLKRMDKRQVTYVPLYMLMHARKFNTRQSICFDSLYMGSRSVIIRVLHACSMEWLT